MIELRPATRDQANALVFSWHRHHKPVRSSRFAAIASIDGEDVGAVIVGSPVARALACDPRTLEVTRLVCRGCDRNVGSRLLGAAWRAARALGARRMVSYVRMDEAGAVYRAAGWRPVAETPARDWTEDRRRLLPGIIEPATEPVPRVRWEICTPAGPRLNLTFRQPIENAAPDTDSSPGVAICPVCWQPQSIFRRECPRCGT